MLFQPVLNRDGERLLHVRGRAGERLDRGACPLERRIDRRRRDTLRSGIGKPLVRSFERVLDGIVHAATISR